MSDEVREDSLLGMIRDFYNAKMASVVILVWGIALVFIALAVYSGIMFYHADDTKLQILFAMLFLCGFEGILAIKVFAWQMIHRNSIKRDIRRLQAEVSELRQASKS